MSQLHQVLQPLYDQLGIGDPMRTGSVPLDPLFQRQKPKKLSVFEDEPAPANIVKPTAGGS